MFYTKKKRQHAALWASGLLGCAVSLDFAWNIIDQGLHENLATWSLVMLLDTVGLTIAVSAQLKKPTQEREVPLMQIGWVIALAFIIAAILCVKGSWKWGWLETSCTTLCLLALIASIIKGHATGLILQQVATYISFFPQIVDYWHRPQPQTWAVWAGSAVACLIAILAVKQKDFVQLFIPISTVFLNVVILILIFR